MWRSSTTRLGRKHDAAARTIQRILVRERDPVSLMPIRRRILLARNGVMIAFDAHVLLAYVRASGDIRDPVAREELRPHELMRLARVCGEPPIAAKQLMTDYQEEIARRELLAYLQDDFLAEARRGTRMFEVLRNIHAVARRDEMAGIYRHFRANDVRIMDPPVDDAAMASAASFFDV